MRNHIPSDVATTHKYLPLESYRFKEIHNKISEWTADTLMKLNETKSKYMVFLRSRKEFDTRLTINAKPIERTYEMVYLGVWLSNDLTWYKHISDICREVS